MCYNHLACENVMEHISKRYKHMGKYKQDLRKEIHSPLHARAFLRQASDYMNQFR